MYFTDLYEKDTVFVSCATFQHCTVDSINKLSVATAQRVMI